MEGLWPDCDPGPDSLLDRARTTLAQPEPEGLTAPTRRQIMMLAEGFATDPGGIVLLVREALRRWGRPASALAQPEPEGLPEDEELLEVAAKALEYKSIPSDETCLTAEAGELLAYARAVLARWGRPAIEPVPVAERPWEREGWCDAEGRCWWGRPSEELCNSDWYLATRAEVEEFCSGCMPIVSLPHHALPVPGAEVG
jgi:hypothetical protein